MPDSIPHRGPHSTDHQLFSAPAQPALLAAVDDLSLLLDRGYATPAALKLVGDRHQLVERQRSAVLRCACSEHAARDRRARRLEVSGLRARELWIDGLNCIIGLEAALAGAVLLRGRDSALRDLASVHGSYALVSDTPRAIQLLGSVLAATGVVQVRILIDRPVSKSGQLRALIEAHAQRAGWPWRAELQQAPDQILSAAGAEVVVATSDSAVLDRCGAWLSITDAALMHAPEPQPWILDLSSAAPRQQSNE